MAILAWSVHLNGVVQGVGFRPFVYKLALELNISGWVSNTGRGVYVWAEGEEETLQAFYERLLKEAPPLAKIQTSGYQEVGIKGYAEFEIRHSKTDEQASVLVSPDIATCPDCLRDITDSANRRHQYPFTNCTNCGPRYTIIRDVPYDRARTTMAGFPLCPECKEEYENPLNRRFHAQPVACPKCGPEAVLLDAAGHRLDGLGIKELSAGAIVAVKGLGGFHLVCDAKNRDTVKRLRSTKERGAKPFALMARNLEVIRTEAVVSEKEAELLPSGAAPIVILPKRRDVLSELPAELAPGLHTLGMMLPYTPLHHLLFAGPYDFLVATSANLSGQPLIYDNAEAMEKLAGIADYFLMHNREIYHPCDDSVIQIIGGESVFMRRARGYVPLPLESFAKVEAPIFGVGGELKNAFCLAEGNRAFVSQYIGDMDDLDNFQRFCQEVSSFQQVANISPQVLAHDKHPNYQTTHYALASPLTKVSVQHHHAHLVSVLGEWGYKKPALGLICDGTGYGDDGKIWGFEFLFGDARFFERRAHLEYLPLPGGDAGAKHPLRIAYAYAKYSLPEDRWEETAPLWGGLTREEQIILDKQLQGNFQMFYTSSAGRLFDAVSALLGICNKVTYEGQAAIELESAAAVWAQTHCEGGDGWQRELEYIYQVELIEENGLVLRVRKLFTEIIEDLLEGLDRGCIAYCFHLAMAKAMVMTALRLGAGQGPLVINGGVFQNKLLTELLLTFCEEQGIELLRAKMLPPGDGGLAFGQVLIANEVLKNVFSDSSQSQGH